MCSADEPGVPSATRYLCPLSVFTANPESSAPSELQNKGVKVGVGDSRAVNLIYRL